MPESFAVRVPCPEAYTMLEALALKSGCTYFRAGSNSIPEYAKRARWFTVRNAIITYCQEESNNVIDAETISIEQAIAELQKPREKPITISGRTLSFPGDGSIKLSCGDVISAEVADEIERRRKPSVEYKLGDISGSLYRRIKERVEVFHVDHWVDNTDSHASAFNRDFKPITPEQARAKYPGAFA